MLQPGVESVEPRQLLSLGPVVSVHPASAPVLDVALAPRSSFGTPSEGVTAKKVALVRGQTTPGQRVGLEQSPGGPIERFARADRSGRFTMTVVLHPGVNQLAFASVRGENILGTVPLTLVSWPKPFFRPYNGSPTPPDQPFTRLMPPSNAEAPGVPPRPSAEALSQSMAEDPSHPAFSPNIELGLVFFGQFVDHDLNFNLTDAGQGPSADPLHPINQRTPALDLDPVYGKGPHGQPEFYTPDGLFFQLGPGGTDLLRDANGTAIIGDPRNDDNGQIASIHVAFQRFHNTLMAQALHGADPNSLTAAQKDALFNMVRNEVIAFYQGIVANQLATAFTGRPIPRHEPPLANIPVEFSGAVFRLGHTLVPNTVIVDHQGDTKSPTDPSMRGPSTEIPYDLLFGPHAQPAANFDNKISNTMRTLLIPLSPIDPSQGDLIGGNSPNIGAGQIINGVMHLDLGETNILRGRELDLPSGEAYLAKMEHRPYDPQKDGNTDLFVYVLDEATPLGHLGRVGTDIFDRAIGGTLAEDPYAYSNRTLFTPQQITQDRRATFEQLLHVIGAPGF